MFLTLVPRLSSLGGFGVPPLHLSLSSRCFCLMYGAWFKETRGDSARDDTTQGREWKWVGFFFLTLKDPWRFAQRACSFSVTLSRHSCCSKHPHCPPVTTEQLGERKSGVTYLSEPSMRNEGVWKLQGLEGTCQSALLQEQMRPFTKNRQQSLELLYGSNKDKTSIKDTGEHVQSEPKHHLYLKLN